MILGVGIDLVEIRRLARVLEAEGARGEEAGALEARVFGAGELASCAARADRVAALAARFAAKEAFVKALGEGWGGGRVALRDVEVQDGAGGPPELRLSGEAARRAAVRGVRRAHVSLTHEDGVAAAVVVLED